MSYRFYSAILVCLIPFIADARLPDFTDLVEEASPAVVKINVSFKEQDINKRLITVNFLGNTQKLKKILWM